MTSVHGHQDHGRQFLKTRRDRRYHWAASLLGSRHPLSQDNERTFLKHDLTTLSPHTNSWLCVEYAPPASLSTDMWGGLVSTLLRAATFTKPPPSQLVCVQLLKLKKKKKARDTVGFFMDAFSEFCIVVTGFCLRGWEEGCP